jgi:hypothetical protein
MVGSASGRPYADVTIWVCERRASIRGAARPAIGAQDLRVARPRAQGLQLARAANATRAAARFVNIVET